VWAAAVGAAFGVGTVLRHAGVLVLDASPPLHGGFRVPAPALALSLVPAAAVAAVCVTVLPRLCATLPRLALAGTAWGCAALWATVLAASDGVLDGDLGALARPLESRYEYLAVLPAIGDDPLGWLAAFTERLPGYPTHVQGHPPLPPLLLWGLARLGLAGSGPAAAVIILVGASAPVAIALFLWRASGEDAARRALPYLVLLPAAVWVATSMDALFLGWAAWSMALLAYAARAGGARGPLAALAGGVLLGALPYLSYGLVPFLLLPLVAAVTLRPPVRIVVAALLGAAAVTGAFLLAGFWWLDGVQATAAAWAADPGSERPYLYFLFANLAVLALVTGPATAAGLARITPPLLPWVAAALVAVLTLDLSGVTRGEVERIWLPYAYWVAVAAAVLPGRASRRALAAQAGVGLLLQALIDSPW
jgi:hypothetical protein